jgi:hypothetical protein
MCKYARARVIFMNLALIKADAFKIKASMSWMHDKQSISRVTGVDTVLGGVLSHL